MKLWLTLSIASLVVAVAACSSDHAAGPTAGNCGPGGTPVSLVVGGYLAVDPGSDSGCVRFAANGGVDSMEYLLVPQSAAGVSGEVSPFQLTGGAITVAAGAALATRAPLPGGHGAVAEQFDATLRGMARAKAYPVNVRSATAAVQAAGPTSVRSFTLCGNLSCSSFKTVTASQRVLGAHVAIYVDTMAPAAGLDSADLDSLSQILDSRLFPLDTTTFGSVSDIDANGVVIVLMTGAVNALVSRAQCHADGYVAGFFFGGDLDPAFASQFNHGEIYYSIVADPDSTLSCAHSRDEVKQSTPVTFTHEFQHMISFVQHVLVRGGDPEEGWLDEGLSKYAEELGGRSYLPGDPGTFSQYLIGDVFDAYQYLNATGNSPLLIPADTGSLAEVGASWLFVRYLVDQFGDSLPRKLHETSLVGAANVTAQTGESFETLVERWALANWVSDLPGFTAPAELHYSSWHFRNTFGSLNSQDPADFPQPYPLVPARGLGRLVNLSGSLRSGSGMYQRALQAPGDSAFSLYFRANGYIAIAPAVVPRLTIVRIR